MMKGPKEPLFDPTWEEMVAREPLLAFSFYLSGRVNVLLGLADEIVDHLDEAFAGSVVDGGKLERASSLMWLWSLAAYEVIRTICAAPSCFSPPAHAKFKDLKNRLADIRMPSAKMEKRGKNSPVSSNCSPDGWDVENKDLLIGDPDGSLLSARVLLTEFQDTFALVSKDDVLNRHESIYRTDT
jgi:hypothetical protein